MCSAPEGLCSLISNTDVGGHHFYMHPGLNGYLSGYEEEEHSVEGIIIILDRAIYLQGFNRALVTLRNYLLQPYVGAVRVMRVTCSKKLSGFPCALLVSCSLLGKGQGIIQA